MSTSPSPIENHRKRRRNRMRVSCINCYASKRKCDRKRPCTRCIKHGLTGLCVYELDDPNSRDKPQTDEPTRLRTRIAELESVIRALNNRPHPRWLAPDGLAHDPSLLRPAAQTRSKARLGIRGRATSPTPSVEAFFHAGAESHIRVVKHEEDAFTPEFTPSEYEPEPESPLTPLSIPSRTLGKASGSPASSTSSDEGPPLSFLFPPRVMHSFGMQTSPPPDANMEVGAKAALELNTNPCDCLTDATVYAPLVHFSSALRTARDALEGLHNSDVSGGERGGCLLWHRVLELDEYIFSAPPPSATPDPDPDTQTNQYPTYDFLNNVYASPLLSLSPTSQAPTLRRLTPILTPSSPPGPHISLSHPQLRHAHAHTLRFYSPIPETEHDEYLGPLPGEDVALTPSPGVAPRILDLGQPGLGLELGIGLGLRRWP